MIFKPLKYPDDGQKPSLTCLKFDVEVEVSAGQGDIVQG